MGERAVTSVWHWKWSLATIRLLTTGLASVAGQSSPGQAPQMPRDAMAAPVALALVATVAPVPMTAVADAQRRTLAAADACFAYLEVLRQAFGEGELLWRNAYSTYCRLAIERGWPILSEKALSQGLASHGCMSVQRDLRGRGKGRPRMLIWTADAETEAFKQAA
jgi:hypothetical protein